MRTAWRTHSSLITGSMPGMAASTSDTCEFGSPPNAVEAPENNFACEVTWACTSMPMTTSQSPVAPLISFDFCWAGASMCRARVGLRLRASARPPQALGKLRPNRGRKSCYRIWHELATCRL